MAKKQLTPTLDRVRKERERVKNVEALSKKLSPKQMDALLEAVNILREFDCDYCEGYELFDATIPRRMIEIKDRVQKEFFMTGGYGYEQAVWMEGQKDV